MCVSEGVCTGVCVCVCVCVCARVHMHARPHLHKGRQTVPGRRDRNYRRFHGATSSLLESLLLSFKGAVMGRAVTFTKG